jgi:hypothetical protein
LWQRTRIPSKPASNQQPQQKQMQPHPRPRKLIKVAGSRALDTRAAAVVSVAASAAVSGDAVVAGVAVAVQAVVVHADLVTTSFRRIRAI